MKINYNKRAKRIYSLLKNKDNLTLFQKSFIDIYNKDKLYIYLDTLDSSKIDGSSDIDISLSSLIELNFLSKLVEYNILVENDSATINLISRENRYLRGSYKLNIKMDSYNTLEEYLAFLFNSAYNYELELMNEINNKPKESLELVKDLAFGIKKSLAKEDNRDALLMIISLIAMFIFIIPICIIPRIIYYLIGLILILIIEFFYRAIRMYNRGIRVSKLKGDEEALDIRGEVESIKPSLILKRKKGKGFNYYLSSLYIKLNGATLLFVLNEKLLLNSLSDKNKIKNRLIGKALYLKYYKKSKIVVFNAGARELIEKIEGGD